MAATLRHRLPEDQMPFAALIVAAGRGHRAGGGIPKQFRDLGGKPLLQRTVRAFLDHPQLAQLAVVIHPDDTALYAAALQGVADARLLPAVQGGAERQDSVRAGLEALAGTDPEIVLIHDAARPFTPPEVIDRVLAGVAETGAAFPALPIVDALWRVEDGLVRHAEDRSALWRAQTPQGFRFGLILAAHRSAAGAAPDDVAIARAAGHDVRVVMGDGNNFKITLAEDFDRARRLMGDRMDIRTGNGFDVHAFGEGDHVVLCGVRIPHPRGLKGHSDADVAMHALTDAIFGALAEGDIGRWFPPSDMQWKGAQSEIFLAKAMERAADRGFRVNHLDCTIICETPKIGPHAADMTDQIARITGLSPDRISIKATTSERLGFTGRGEGIAALATATLVAE